MCAHKQQKSMAKKPGIHPPARPAWRTRGGTVWPNGAVVRHVVGPPYCAHLALVSGRRGGSRRGGRRGRRQAASGYHVVTVAIALCLPFRVGVTLTTRGRRARRAAIAVSLPGPQTCSVVCACKVISAPRGGSAPCRAQRHQGQQGKCCNGPRPRPAHGGHAACAGPLAEPPMAVPRYARDAHPCISGFSVLDLYR